MVLLPEMLFLTCRIPTQTFKANLKSPLLCEAFPDAPRQN